MNQSRSSALRERLRSPHPLVAPGAFNALTARMVEQSGFEAVYATGAGISNAYLGVPDLGILTMHEMAQHVRAMQAVTSVPIIVDVDTGYGGVHNVARAVFEMEGAGAAGIQLEDQTFPKRCGHFDRKAVVPRDEMIAKILAAVDSQRTGLVLIARTDAVAVEGYQAAVERAKAYFDAGADVVFVEALETEEQIRSLARDVPGPKLMNLVEGGKTPFLPLDTLGSLGYAIIALANFALRSSMQAVLNSLANLKDAGTSESLTREILSWDERQEIVGLAEYDSRSDQWAERAALLGAKAKRVADG